MPEDPLLPDATRRALSPELEDAHARAENERTLLALAVGAAERRVIALASIATSEGRPRVPSVYFVELLGRRLGRVASGADVGAAMASAVSAIGAPDRAARSSERTIALLRELATLPRDEARGRANHVTERNPFLRSALRRAWRLETPRLHRSDGLVQTDASDARAPLLAHDPGKRPYSATALESFAKCPLQFHMKSVLRLEPREEPVPLEEIDPLVRGSIFHEAQFLTLLALRDDPGAPSEKIPHGLATLERIFAALRADLVDRLVPAIPRVFHHALDGIEADLREWLVRVVSDPDWQPQYFELAFGLPGDDGRDPASRAEPIPLDEGITLRGAIDLVERSTDGTALRATDSKTGSSYPIRDGRIVVRGGQTLQPVLYALALSKLFPDARVVGGRLWYCTSKGRFDEQTVPLDDDARASARALSAAITEALSRGALPAVPIDDKTCAFCDYALACGPRAWAQSTRLPQGELATRLPKLVALRGRR
jgi:CRISPR/Cas system-associated exonuclease Cas4 (RecB family)